MPSRASSSRTLKAHDVSRIVRSLRSIAVASAFLPVWSALECGSVRAQSAATETRIQPLPTRRAEPARRPPQPLPQDDDDGSPPVVTDPASATDSRDPNASGVEPGDGDDPARAEGRNTDGLAPVGTERDPNRDGVLPGTNVEPAPRDGEPDTTRDARRRADIDAFEKPAAGYDAVAFQIEFEPILDRRPARLARFEPYDPTGIRRGSWIIFPEVEFGIGVTSNARRTPGGGASALIDVKPSVRAVTDWRQHAIELRASGFASAFAGFASENDKAYALEARGRYDFSRRTNAEVLVSRVLAQEQRSAPDADTAARDRTTFVTTRAALALNQRFNRLTLQLRGGISDVDYSDNVAISGTAIDNRARSYLQRDVAARASWEFTPTLAAFTDVTRNDRRFAALPVDGIGRDSTGYRAVAGISFGNAGRIWRGEIGVGYGEQRPDDARLAATGGMILDANLSYKPSELTSFLLTARTDFNDSTTTGQSGSLARVAGLEVRHALRRELIATAALRHTVTDYRGVSLTERETAGDLGLEYYLNQSTTLFSRYTHTWFDTTAAGGDYAVDAIRFGVRIRP